MINFFFYVKTSLEKIKAHLLFYQIVSPDYIWFHLSLSAIPWLSPNLMTIRFGGELDSAKDIWERALGELQLQVSRANYTTWLKNSYGVNCQENVFIIGVHNAFIAEWLTKRLHPLIRKTLAQILGRDIDIQFIIHNQDQVQNVSLSFPNQADGGTSTKARIYQFNPKYTFDDFIVGDCNRLAYAATTEIAENPGHVYNPLLIYSSTGQGKTHLLHAIGHRAIDSGLHVVYTGAEQFTNEFVLAIKHGQVHDFYSKFKSIHILLFDDMQFINDKKQTQQCFFQIFNELYSNNCQIVIAADRHPKDMPLLSNKLKSRLEWGLIAPIQPPDFETRLSILRAKAQEMMIQSSDEILHLIAEHLQENVRRLEGALLYLTCHAKLTGTELTPQIVNRLLTSTANKQEKGLIVQAVADCFNLPIEVLTGKKRDRNTSLARQIAMFIMREESNYSFTEIGKALGNRNHATIIHGYKKIATEISVDIKLRRRVSDLKEKIHLDRAATKKC